MLNQLTKACFLVFQSVTTPKEAKESKAAEAAGEAKDSKPSLPAAPLATGEPAVYTFMFNPSELTFSNSVNFKNTSGGGGKEKDGGGQTTESQFTGKVNSTLKMTLYFDTADKVDDSAMSALKAKVADTAMLTQIGSLLTGDGTAMEKLKGTAGMLLSPSDESKISVLKATDCGKIERLVLPIKAAGNHPPTVVFVWGTMRHPGYIEQVVSKYTMFSSRGTPLRAELNITMRLSAESLEDAEAINPLAAAASDAAGKKRPSILGF